MRVWVGCLGCYNGGTLFGHWFDVEDQVPQDGRELAEYIVTEHVGTVPGEHVVDAHEELWVFDTDEVPHPSLAREMSPAEALEIGTALATSDLTEDELEPYAAWLSNYGYDFTTDRVDDFREAYCGQHASQEEYAQELAEELDLIPQNFSWPASYIDWERAARDLFMDYWDAPATGGGIHVFRDC